MLPLSRTETETIVDGDAPVNQSEKGKVEGGQGGATEETVLVEGNILSRMSSARKNLLLVIFSSAMFLGESECVVFMWCSCGVHVDGWTKRNIFVSTPLFLKPN